MPGDEIEDQTTIDERWHEQRSRRGVVSNTTFTSVIKEDRRPTPPHGLGIVRGAPVWMATIGFDAVRVFAKRR